MNEPSTFDLATPLPAHQWLLLEASAGTGKTYSLTALVARYVAEQGLRAEELLMVTFTRAAAAEMKHEVREQLVRASQALHASDPSELDPWLANLHECSPAELELRRQRVDTAISDIDSATISTIHGFFQQALGDLGIRSGEASTPTPSERDVAIAHKVVRDVMVNRYAVDATALDPTGLRAPSAVEGSVLKVLRETSTNLGAQLAPAPDGSPAGQWSATIADLRAAIRAERRVQGIVSFDDLITDLIDRLADPVLGPEIVRILRSRYRLVLIDEFQDTDAFQWALFSTVFDLAGVPEEFLALIVVGDPKQAIYRFRGADIDAYLTAASHPSMTTLRMTTNHRSDRPLVESLNAWLAHVTFGSHEIAYVPVTTPAHHAEPRLFDAGAPLQFRFLANPQKKAVGDVRVAIAIDVADHIQELLERATIATEPLAKGGTRPVELADICILVRTHGDADPLVAELRARHIPVVRSRIGSVLESEAVDQLRMLLTAMASPGDPRRVRALQLSWFAADPVGVSEVEPESDAPVDPVELLQVKCRSWASELETRGLVGWYQSLRLDEEVVNQISSDFEAERRLTDLEHVIELLDAQLGGRRAPVRTVLRALDELEATMSTEADAQKRRIETDRDVIQITTMHSAKGLEFPIVLMPFPKGIRDSSSAVYELDGTRYVDAAPDIDWTADGLDRAERKRLDRRAVVADELRLLYVAVTRARHQLVIWWGRGGSATGTPLAGALGRVLFGSTSDLDTPATLTDDDEARDRLTTLVAELGDDVAFVELDRWDDDRTWPAPAAPTVDTMRSRSFPDRHVERSGWYRWSYSSLSKGARAVNEGTARGGADEVPSVPGVDAIAGEPTFTGPLLGMQASAEFGTFVHELFEAVDYTASDLRSELLTLIEASGRAESFDADPHVLADGLVAAIDTPLVPDADAPTLRSFGSQRLDELVFHFPLVDGDRPLAPAALFELAATHESGVFGEYFASLASGNRMTAIAGLMTGSIDSVVRLGTPTEGVYGVIDYKTNRLHAPGDVAPISAYGRDSMARAMEHGDYPLQILVYNIALHRMLQARLDGYDIDRHIGPSRYLFVRGMIGADTPIVDGTRNGVFEWRPTSQLIAAASQLLGGRT